LNDPHLRQIGLGARHAQTTGSIPRRPDSRPTHPFFLQQPNHENPRQPSPAPLSRPPYQGIPPRSTPTPEQRNYNTGLYRATSHDHAQDGRYPNSAPLSNGFVNFPSPHPRSDSAGSYRGSVYDHPSSPGPSPPLGSPQTALPRRPTTLYDDEPPRTSDYAQDRPQGSWRPRSESDSAAHRDFSPLPEDYRRSRESSAIIDDTQLPYIHVENLSDQPWNTTRPPRFDSSDTASVAGTVRSGYSDATTIRAAQDGDDDSGNTARALELTQRFQGLMDSGGTLRPASGNRPEEEEEEATLFWSSPVPSESPKPIQGLFNPSKPNLTVRTMTPAANNEDDYPTPSDSATESESDSRVSRAKSFARPKDQPEVWHIRPEPDQLYDNLDNFFPRIDLDKPIVDPGMSQPSTPASENPPSPSPSREANIGQPPPLHPSRVPQSPRVDEFKPMPPPQHPAVKEQSQSVFSKMGNRKSIRLMAESKRKTIQRESKVDEGKEPRDVAVLKQESTKKFSPGRRLSMWGHRIQEVTATKINGGIPPTVPEAPLADGKPRTSLCFPENLG
jgi:mitogen-activated protein kinase kinase kinase